MISSKYFLCITYNQALRSSISRNVTQRNLEAGKDPTTSAAIRAPEEPVQTWAFRLDPFSNKPGSMLEKEGDKTWEFQGGSCG
jgi:hypothetical protein